MLQVRKNVFETNSSSTHSISLGEGDYIFDTSLTPSESGYVEIYGDEFGWEQATYNSACVKASYSLVYCLNWSYENKDKHLQMLIDVITEQTDCVGVKWVDDGYIDHQSAESNQLDYLFEDKKTLRRFIFDKQSVLVTDNDNH